MAKFDPFLSLDCARVEGVGAQSKERKGSNFAAQHSGAISDVAIPGLESVPVPNFEVFSDNCDSNSNSGSNRCWN